MDIYSTRFYIFISMKIFLSLFSISLFSLFTFSQNQKVNVQKKYAAEGYDVVAYHSNKAVKGNLKFISSYKKVNYKFYNAKNLELFKTNPNKYIPEYGGYCAYAMGKDGSLVKINPKTFEVRNGKLYLFYNSFGVNTLDSWTKESAERLQKSADKYWLEK